MPRVTKKQLQIKVDYIKELSKLDLTIGYAYGRPRVYIKNESKELSPRLPSGQLWDWLDAFEQGLTYGFKISEAK